MGLSTRLARTRGTRSGRVGIATLGVLVACVAIGIGLSKNPRMVGIAFVSAVIVLFAVLFIRSASSTHGSHHVPAAPKTTLTLFESPAWRLPLYLAAFLLSVDGTGYWSSGQRRYLVVLLALVPLTGLLLGKQTARSAPWYFLLVGWLMGLLGSLLAFARGDENTWLQVFLPLTIVLILGGLDLSADQASLLRTGSHTVMIGASIISIVGAITWMSGLRAHSGLTFVRQEMAFVYLSAIVLSWLLGHRLLLLGNLASLGVAFYAYPAATYPIVVTSLVLALLSFGLWSGRVWRWTGRFGLALLIGVGGRLVVTASTVTQSYAASVGKLDNSAFRRELWLRGLRDFQHSPLVGSMWTGPYNVVDLNVPGIIEFSAPIHNEYISVLRSGGAIGFVLIVFPLVAIFRTRRSTTTPAGRHFAGRRLETFVKACAVAFLVASFFNPLWAKTSTALFGWLLVGLAMAGAQSSRTSHAVHAQLQPVELANAEHSPSSAT